MTAVLSCHVQNNCSGIMGMELKLNYFFYQIWIVIENI